MTADLAAALLGGIAAIISALAIGFTRIIRELKPNGGQSLRDRVDRIEIQIQELHKAVTTRP